MSRGRRLRGSGGASLAALCLLVRLDGTASPAEVAPRARIVVVLDSSGSMREAPLGRDSDDDGPLVDAVSEGELVGDDPESKLAQAKRVLAKVLETSPSGVRFLLGKYRQSAAEDDFGPEIADRFLYATMDSRASGLVVNPRGDGASRPGLKRAGGDEWRTGDVTSYYLFAGKLWNGQRVAVLADGTQPAVVADLGDFNPPFVELQVKDGAGRLVGSPVRFEFRGVRWNKANKKESPGNRAAVLRGNASCGGFAPLATVTPAGADGLKLLGSYLNPEVFLRQDGSIEGYVEGPLGAPPAKKPLERGIRASGMTPLAESLIDVGELLAAEDAGMAKEGTSPPRTFVILVTDGDDTCVDRTTGQISSDMADLRALRVAHKAQTLAQRSVPVFVVNFGTGVSSTRADWIAWAGSGMTRGSVGTGPAASWEAPPRPEERAGCQGCVDAFRALNAPELETALRGAIDRGLAQ